MLREVLGASGRARGRRMALLTVVAALIIASTAMAASRVHFDGSPGTNPPPKRLDGLKMRKFGRDHRGNRVAVKSVPGPTGRIDFNTAVVHFTVRHKRMHWQTWSHNYHGDIYYVAKSVTLRLPRGTTGFYFYAEPNDSTPEHPTFTLTARTAGASSGPIVVAGKAGATFFGFVARGGARLRTIKVTSSDKRVVSHGGEYVQVGGFAIGEFGIHGR